MCFYYSITKKSVNALVKGQIIKDDQLSLFNDQFIVNGFEHPLMPVITDEKPEEVQYFKWGFMPGKVKTLELGTEFLNKYNTLNAKAEDIENSRLYGDSFMHRRCLVLCSGFFEWRKVKNEKIPYYITLKNDELFVFAGIWNRTTDDRGKTMDSYAILTIEANELLSQIHNTKCRMPLILSPDDANKWISPGLSPEELGKIIKAIPSNEFKAYTIKKFLPSQSHILNSADIIAYYNYPHIPDIIIETT